MLDNPNKYMHRCLELAKKGVGNVSPNPMVGAVVVADGKIIGEGYHRYYGGPHAEVEALKSLTTGKLSNATLYLNLEPCCHWGKTPPCTDLILKLKVPRVVVGMIDPNPKVNCSGIETLRSNGVEVSVGLLEKRCRELNWAYIKRRSYGLPGVILKTATTIDGRIGTSTGDSRWITSKKARAFAHQIRAECDAILVGIGTILADDPMLTVRHVKGRNPVRVVLDKNLRTPLNSKVLEDQKSAPTIIFTQKSLGEKEIAKYDNDSVKIVQIDLDETGDLSLHEVLKYLSEKGILTVMVEGGRTVFTSFIMQNIIDRLITVVAPKIIGEDGVPVFGKLGIKNMSEVDEWSFNRVKRIGPDVMFEIIHREY
jgi:diaminohydroxyphosphoribosylaminopyrimidine deaminase/5-amino-6-(5-phosphoribosylamino)uracil reductase